MPRNASSRVPGYRLHKPTGQAVVRLNGKDFYLGRHGSPASRAEYDRLVAEWVSNGRRPADAGELTVNTLLVAYLDYAKGYYVKAGRPTSELATIKAAMRPLARLYGDAPAAQFGPLAFKTVRDQMIDLGWCRNHINKQASRIKSIFRWGVENELVLPAVHQGLLAVRGLAKGRTTARESDPIRPVADAHVEAVRPFVSRQVWAMIEIQRLTGMRPGEVVIMRPCDIDMTGHVWLYRPAYHKTEHHDKQRVVEIGPRAQAVIHPFLKPDVEAYLFSPTEAETDRRARQHAARTTPLSCGNRPGTNRRPSRRRPPRDRYTQDTYRRAIDRAIEDAFPPPPHLARRKVAGRKGRRWETNAEWMRRLGSAEGELKAWQKEHHWHPNQLRHNFATWIRKTFSLEAARILLGHSSMATSEIYAEIDREKVRGIIAKVG